MKRFIFVLMLLGAGAVGMGFYLKWFNVASESGSGKSNVTISMDTDKIHKDSKTAVANVQDVGRQLKHTVAGPDEKSMDGKVVSISGDKLTMTNLEGKEHSHTLPANVAITCDGNTCTAAELKAGMRIRVARDAANPQAAARIEALDKDTAFASRSHDGKAVRITGDELVMTMSEGKGEQTWTLPADIKVTCDGKVCKTADLKPGMRVRVTADTAGPHMASRIEALDVNRDFEKGV